MNFRVVDRTTGANTITPNPGCCPRPDVLCRLCALTLLGLDPLTLDQLSGRAVANSGEMVPAEDGSDANEFAPMPRLDYAAISAAGRSGSKPPAVSTSPAQAEDDEAAPMPRLDYAAIVASRDRFR